MKRLAVLPLALSCLVSVGFAQNSGQTSKDPVKFLKWSMDRMASYRSFHAEATWKMRASDSPQFSVSHRTVDYVRPNKFRVVSNNGFNTLIQTSVCDGSKLVDYTNNSELPASSYGAPTSICNAQSMQMGHPMFCGSLIYQFFGGSKNYSGLVNSQKKKVVFGAKEKAGGEQARNVKFYGTQTYGEVEVLIGTKTGFVYRISYDSAELVQMMGSAGKAGLATIETYSKFRTNQPILAATFDTTPPKGITAEPVPTPDSPPEPPVALGTPAPDIELTGVDGQKVKLSSQKGKVVLIDFWATWCPPCREGLPITNRMHEKFASRGLQVFTVSDEDLKTVTAFIKENKYTFPAFLDPGDRASKVYKIVAIPTVVVIDANGNLVSYSVGLEPEDNVIANLKKAGLKVD